MNAKRIIVWSIWSYLATFIAGVIPGVVQGTYASAQLPDPAWIYPLQVLLFSGSVLVVFFLFARVQRERTVAHAVAVWVLVAVGSHILNVVLGLEFPMEELIKTSVMSGLLAAMGVGAGLGFTKIQEG
jgi:hypothetical protein